MGRPIDSGLLVERLRQIDARFISTEVLIETLIPAMPTAKYGIPIDWIEKYRERHVGDWKAMSLDSMLEEWKNYGKV